MPRPDPTAKLTPVLRLRAAACLLCAAGFFLCVMFAVSSAPPRAAVAPGAPAAAQETPAPALPGPAIVIDPGHGGSQPGRVSGTEYEKHWALKVSLALADELRHMGYPVELTRSDDSHVELVDRAAFSNRAPRRAFVSIHFNAGVPEAAGIETYYAWPREPATMARMAASHSVPEGRQIMDDRSRLLAASVQASVTAATGARDRGVINNSTHAVTRRTEAPAILVECGFLSNPAELALIQTDAYRARLVHGIAAGIHTWLHSGAGGPEAIKTEPLPETPPPPAADCSSP